ncbi:DUF5819 family protein [Acrocarpospora phusangensis]|nr:DUF5819 family protein [Acrocarpospora phusangensis]
MAPERRSRWVLALFSVGCVAATCFHFLMTFLYVAPWNHVYDSTSSLVNGYMNPYFRQTWDLFAPDPVDYNPHVLVRAKVGDRETAWVDVSERELALIRGHLLPGRASRLAAGAKQMLNRANVVPVEGAAEEGKGQDPVLQAKAVRHMRAVATLAALAEWGPGVEAVQVKTEDRIYPRFADRADEGAGEVVRKVYAWWPPANVSAGAVERWKDAVR